MPISQFSYRIYMVPELSIDLNDIPRSNITWLPYLVINMNCRRQLHFGCESMIHPHRKPR